MKKVFAAAAKILFAAFGIAVLGLLMSLTFGALGKIFPNNFNYQLWGLVLFDIGAIIWALVFVFASETTGQYALSVIGFLAAFVGTLGMVAVEVMLSGQTYVEVEPWVGQWLIYGFVIVTAIHSALLYGHHAAAADINEQISVGIARGEIVSEAIRQATHSLDVQKAILAESITQKIVDQVRRDLGMSRRQVLDLPALPVTDSPALPVAQTPAESSKPKPGFSWPSWLTFPWWSRNGQQIYESVVPAVEPTPAPIQEPEVNKADPEAGQPRPEPFRDAA